MNHIKQFPHCDARILHAPGECVYCDEHPDWQELRQFWHIAFTGDEPKPVFDSIYPNSVEGTIFPCPADAIRGKSHTKWGGNIARPASNGSIVSELPKTPNATTLFGPQVTDSGEMRSPAIPQADSNAPTVIDRSAAPAPSEELAACEWCKESGHPMTSYMTMKPLTKVKRQTFWCTDAIDCALRALRNSPVGG